MSCVSGPQSTQPQSLLSICALQAYKLGQLKLFCPYCNPCTSADLAVYKATGRRSAIKTKTANRAVTSLQGKVSKVSASLQTGLAKCKSYKALKAKVEQALARLQEE